MLREDSVNRLKEGNTNETAQVTTNSLIIERNDLNDFNE